MQRLQGFANRVVTIGLCILTVALMLAPIASGQENQGAIAGNVTDPTGALITGAKLTAKNRSTGAVYGAVSSSAGAYRFPNVNIGTYDVTVSATGFKTVTLTGIVVQVATTSALDVKLSPGAITESVVVNADAPTVQSESADIGTVVGTTQILNLPLALGSTVQAMRSPEAFVYLTPGSVGPGSDSGNGGTFESKISGGQNYGTEVLLDGASMTRSENGSSFDETAPSVDALSEFKVITSTLPAEFGMTTGGIESFNTKGGTNTYHGEIYDIFRNEDLDANTWGNDFALSQGLPYATFRTPLDKQNDYGGTFGGPFRIPHLYNGKDKTFFFFSWEQYRQSVGGTQPSTVPTNAELGGDFSATLDTGNVLGTNPCDGTPIYQGEIFDPATTQTVGGVECRTAFMNEPGSTGNVIPSNRFSTVGQNLLSYYPTAQTSGLANNYTFGYSYPILDTTMTFRIDQNISEKSKAYFTYSSRNNVRTSTVPEWANPAGAGRDQFFGTHYIRFGYDYSITPSMLNHLNLGYNRTNSKNVGAGVGLGHGEDWDATLGITGASGPMFPAIAPGEPPIAGYGDNVDGDTIDNGFRFADTLTWVKGKHEFKFGYEQWYQQFNPLNFQNTSGSFNFGRGQTAGTAATSNLSGNGIASMLLGELDSANVTAYASQPRWLRSYFGGFVQDTIKVTPTLTLNLGLRYDVDEPEREAHGNTSNISLTQPNPGAGNLPGVLVFAGTGAGRNGNVDERWANIWKKDIGPRIGVAWAPAMFNNKMVFRGGYGIIYGNLQYADFGGFNRTGFQANPSFNSINGFDPALQIDSGLPSYPAPPNLDPTQLNFTGPQYTDPSYGRPPMTQNWSLEIQKELAPDLIMDLAYVGQHSQNLRSNYDAVNTLNPQYFSMGASLLTPIGSQTAVAPPYAGFPSSAIVAQALVPFPQYFGFNTDGQLENLGQSTYNALEAQLTRRFRNGLNLMASYTWSKTLTNADSALPFFATLHQGGAPQNVFNPQGDKAISNQDLPQNFVLSYVYELPFGKNKKFLSRGGVVDRVAGGWSVSGIQRYESGQPIAFGCATGVPAYADCIRYDYTGGSIFSSAWKSRKGNFVPITAETFAAGDPGIPIFNPLDTASNATSPAFDDPNSSQNLTSRGTYAFGTSPRVDGSIRMGAYLSEDFNLMKRTQITENSDVLFQVNFLNAFNRHIWNRPGDLGPIDSNALPTQSNGLGGNFGVINWNSFSTTGGGGYLLFPRRIQLQLKVEF
ncbi:MAG TPA: carboxypeptidase-like regulatory domain-containing protein [Verrucomicrobiae bacterium]|nr:carboxypeptidase-like regulatory domain-containing protein [Verrucomicrobiae bacterium]